jgi:2-polyprenyl-3-methyl-5-hydroxy-6-metoxy-1,4-benzoquinol methylase
VADGPSFDKYFLHYQRMRNEPCDWADADRDPTRFAARRPWLPAGKEARILDFGCGWGHQLRSLWCAGYKNLEGVELVPEQADATRTGCGGRIPVTCADGAAYLADKERTYELIILNDVLEHIPLQQSANVLAAIYRGLVPGGTLVIRVPNMSNVLAPYSRYMDITHVVGFTEFSLMQVLDQAGFVDHAFLPDDYEWSVRNWRPWVPWRNLALRGRLNILLHKVLYQLRSQTPAASKFAYNLECYSKRPL